ncbi:hypothetical protein C0993_005097, partial [Termitomyces sp. T159_Od127]
MRRACLVDYGLAAVSGTLGLGAYASGHVRAGSVPWQAPELFGMDVDADVDLDLDVDSGGGVRCTEASDVYAWACVAYE